MRTYEISDETTQAQHTAVASATLPATDIGPWLGRSYGQVATAVAANGTHLARPPFARLHRLPEGRFAVEAGFPVADPIGDSDDVHPSGLPAGPAATTVHVGPYDEMEPAYRALDEWVRSHGGEPAGDPWEIYFSEPKGDPQTWRTEIVQPYRRA